LKLRGVLFVLFFPFLNLVLSTSGLTASRSTNLSSGDYIYLYDLARDTWECIDYFRAPETGFPYDSNLRPVTTNTTNVGLYLVSVVAAEKLGFIAASQARKRITQILTCLKRIDHWHGFLNNHLSVKGKTQAVPGANAVSDFNKLAAALLVIRQAYPDIQLADELFKRIDWSVLWDEKRDRLCQGFDVTDGTLYFWGHGWLASDVRLAVFLGVASGGLPVKAFNRMERNKIKQYGIEFYRPAWDFAGLFMHGMGNLFLDERVTDIGLSTANFAYAQMQFARDKAYPVWGWSACYRPGQGYTDNGLLSQAVVTPHASALVIDYYPRKVMENLKKLEKLGCRQAFCENGWEYAFGFRDSINLTTGEVSNLYYPGLDQAMLFISLANFLKPGCIRNLFAQDPVVKAGLAKLPYFQRRNGQRLRLYAQRDKQPLPRVNKLTRNTQADILVDQFRDEQLNNLGQKRILSCEKMPSQACHMQTLRDVQHGTVLMLDYDLRHYNQGNIVMIESLYGLDASGCNAVTFWCRGETTQVLPLNFRLQITDTINSRVIGLVEEVGQEWRKVVFPFEMFRGILADPSNLRTLEFRLERAPIEFADKPLNVTKGTLYLTDIRLICLPITELKKQVGELINFKNLVLKSQEQLEGFTRLTGWQTYHDADAELSLKVIRESGPVLCLTYNLGKKGKWVAWEKSFNINLSHDFELSFDLKWQNNNNTLEIKFISPKGAVFGKNLYYSGSLSEWTRVVLHRRNFKYLWGGQKGDKLGTVATFGLAISGKPKTKGVVEIRDFRIKILEK